MPSNATAYQCTAFKNGPLTLLGRVVLEDATDAVQSDIASGVYTIEKYDEDDEGTLTAVTGHSAVALTIASCIFDTLQTDDRWSEDSTGYNFKHVINMATNQAFASLGDYKVTVTFTDKQSPAQPIVLVYLVEVKR